MPHLELISDEMRDCAETCRACAESCRDMSGRGGSHLGRVSA